jgi:hypothetical protein
VFVTPKPARVPVAANLQVVTDDNGRAVFPGLPATGVVTITPSRSGFRFDAFLPFSRNLSNIKVCSSANAVCTCSQP